MGICTLALGIVPVFWIYLVFMALFGVAMPIFNTPTTVMLQEKIEENYLGRVFGVMGMISTSMMPIGMLIFGPIADIIAVEWLLAGTGAFIILLAFILGRDQVLLEAGKPVLSES
jgi:MFS transporter, DHA3 family, macrolide efflux protein